ncbi:unnamed protein product [Cuscuta epithymum]|uniref:Uncharacterized protein n=1 Tax=Cuscuta epithymum TaxID=186058 RepID=A0AAV0C576_9ASTE|nr:unnamed protein product [Cuscuta epithymum]
MTRRCSHCSNNGHNSRTCPARGGAAAASFAGGGGVRIFGVRLTEGGSVMKKSASMGNISTLYHSSSFSAASLNPGSPSSDALRDQVSLPDGYASDDPTHASCSTNRRAERKKGIAWTEEEHRLFLVGLQKLGKGDWRGISRNYVTSRTPTQVASHAQKYFIRQCNVTRRKRRSSLFDMVPDDNMQATETQPLPEEQLTVPIQAIETEGAELVETAQADSPPLLHLSLMTDSESVENTPKENITPSTAEAPTLFPTFIPTFIPIPFPIWPSSAVPRDEDPRVETPHHQILKPIPLVPKEPVNVDELVGLSRLSLGGDQTGSCQIGEASRPSAFHASSQL